MHFISLNLVCSCSWYSMKCNPHLRENESVLNIARTQTGSREADYAAGVSSGVSLDGDKLEKQGFLPEDLTKLLFQTVQTRLTSDITYGWFPTRCRRTDGQLLLHNAVQSHFGEGGGRTTD